MIGELLQHLGIPGLIAPFTHQDEESGLAVSLRTSPRYTVLTVNGKELYFLRENGKFDGTGALSSDPTELNGLLADRIREGGR